MVRALLFDLGNVIVAFDFARGYRALEPYARFPAAEISARIAETGLVHPFERGEIASRDFFERLSAALGLSLSYERFCEAWSAIFLPEPVLPEGLLAALHSRCRLVLVSNTNDIHFRMIERTYPHIGHFDAKVLSYQVGAMKPSEKMYAEAVRQAGCRPEECFYTDDVIEFVEAGRRYGLDAAQFTTPNELEAHLRRRGVVWS